MIRPNFFQNSSVHTGLRLDPRTKLFLLLAVNFITISIGGGSMAAYVRMMIAAIPFFLLLTSGKMKGALLYAAFYIGARYAETTLIHTTTGVLNLLAAMLSGMMLRFTPGVVMGYYLLSSTRISELMASMERMHVTQKLTIPLSVMFRFFPTVLEESRAISDAMRMRGVGIRSVSNNPSAILEYRLVPLIMSVVKIGNELSAAALTRGLGNPKKRTNICKIGFGVWDVLFAVYVVAALAGYIFLQTGH